MSSARHRSPKGTECADTRLAVAGRRANAVAWLEEYWPALLLALFLITTLATLPFIRGYWQDEAQIVDWGRVVAHSDSAWAATWDVRDNRPAFLISHLGVLAQFYASKLFDGPLGVRLNGVLGGLFAFGIILRLFRDLGWDRTWAWILGFVFLLDPYFCASYRGGRVDSWAIAFLLLSALLYRNGFARTRFAFLAGSSAAVGLMVWPSSALLLPLVVAIGHTRREGDTSRVPVVRPLLRLGTSFVVTLVLLLATNPQVKASLLDFVELMQDVTMVGGFSPENCAVLLVRTVEAYTKHVLVLVFSVLSALHLLWRRHFLLPIAFFMALALVAATSPYGNRILYVLPIQVLCLGTSLRIARNAFLRSALAAAVVFLVVWNSAFVLALRPVEALRQIRARDAQVLADSFSAAVGQGAYRVYGPWEIYFPGTKLGWQHYCDLRRGTLEDAISRIDFDFAFVESDDPETLQTLLDRGYRHVPDWDPPTYSGKTFLLLRHD